MKDNLKRKLIPAAWAIALVLTVCVAARAQQPSPPKEKDASKPASTADAWKQAMPQNEVEATSADAVIGGAAGAEETFEQIEKRLRALEGRWMEAIKTQDGATLDRILADDFTFVGDHTIAASLDKANYTESALKNWRLTSYSFDSLSVRVYGDTAVVNGVYKQQAVVAGKPWSGEFLVTDVWIKQGKRWRVVTRHLSPAAKTL